MLLFFFKQKTAYGRRISDWSSDVCSSDLQRGQADQSHAWAKAAWRPSDRRDLRRLRLMSPSARSRHDKAAVSGLEQTETYRQNRCQRHNFDRAPDNPHPAQRQTGCGEAKFCRRSEEHTSELKSLMSISYAVFSL